MESKSDRVKNWALVGSDSVRAGVIESERKRMAEDSFYPAMDFWIFQRPEQKHFKKLDKGKSIK